MLIVFNLGKGPSFTLEQAAITQFNLTSDDHLIAFFNVKLRAENRYLRSKIRYSGIRVGISKSGQKLAEDAVDGFSHRKRNVKLIESEIVALNLKLQKASAFDIRYESGLGYLDFDVYVNANVHRELLWGDLSVDCNAIVNITDSSAVRLNQKDDKDNQGLGFPVKCSVDVDYCDHGNNC
ncbi:unnamed protein product [Amaranthus hypochondriacus]